MKLLILLCSIFVIALSEKLSPEEEAKLFNDYLSKFHVKVGRSDVDQKREVFLRHYYDMEDHNERFRNGSTSFQMVINEFSHLTHEEFFRTHTGNIPFTGPEDNSTIPPRIPRSGRMASPASFSWRDMPWSLGPTTNQGNCGSCTIFAVMGVIEAHMRIWYGIDTKLSEQEAMECTGKCQGTLDSQMYDYAKNGIAYDKDFKYVEKPVEGCNKWRPRVPGSKVLNYYRIPRANAARDGMWYLANVGPLATFLCIPDSFQGMGPGVYDEENMNKCGWHAIMVVGYGNEKNKDFWLCRNSWGSGWGDNGYFKMARGKNLDKMEENFTFPNMGW